MSLLGVVGCSKSSNNSNETSVSNGPSQSATIGVQTLKIGVVLPYEGRFAGFGEEGKQGIDLAVQQAQDELGKRLQLSVNYEDSKGDAADAVRAFRKLADQTRVDAVIGEVLSANTLAIAPLAQELKVPLVVPASTAAGITKAGNFVMRVCFLDPEQGSAMASFARNDLKLSRVALLYEKGNDYSAGLAKAFQSAFTALGGRIVGESFLRGEDVDVRAQLVQIRDWQPEAVFLPMEYPTAGQVLKQAASVGLKIQFLGGDAWSSPELFKIGGDAVNGSYITGHFASDSTNAVVQNFVAGFKKRYGVLPSTMAALSYDAARITIDAALRAKGTSSEKLRDALFATRNYPGVTGKITVRPNGDADKDIMIMRVQDKKFDYVGTSKAAD